MALTPIYILLAAFVLDLIFGDPRKLPHLIVYFGNSISLGEQWFNRGDSRVFKGAAVTLVLVALAFALPYAIIFSLNHYELLWANLTFSVIMLFYCLANKTLVKEGYAVFNTLKNEGLEAGRKRLSWIVGRETDKLEAQEIRIATLETLSENLSDGVIAPLFYFFLFGIPGAMAYKMINTLDSMIGYKNERYAQFGKFAARLDDVANFIPARLTAVLMLLVTLKPQGMGFIFREGKKHSSPNAGYPEAALAYILNCRFGGPNYYHGKLVEKPYIGSNKRTIEHHEIKRAAFVNYASSSLFVLLGILFLYLRYYA